MDLPVLLAFCGVYAVATLSPGPAAAAVMARTLSVGWRRTVPFIAGIVLGDLVWLALVSLGLAVVAAAFRPLFLVIQYAGAAYLLFMAWKLWTADAAAPAPAPARGEGFKLLLAGLSLTLGNPKVAVFFLAVLPQVVSLEAMSAAAFAQIAALSVVILSAAMSAYALAAERARRVVADPRRMKLINRVTGGVMAGVAVAVASRA